MKNLTRLSTAGVALALFVSGGPAVAADFNPDDTQWRFAVTPYGWFPSISGDLRFTAPGGNPRVDIDPDNYLSNLQFAGMLAAEIRKGRFSIWNDLVYVDLSSLTSKVKEVTLPGGRVTVPVNADLNVGIKSLIWTGAVSYTVVHQPRFSLDVMGGVRYGGIKASLDANASGPLGQYGFSRGTTQKVDLWDGIVGVRGSATLTQDGKWYVPYELDVGAGSNNKTLNGIVGVGYRFGWGDVIAAWRYLSFRMDGDDALVQDLQLSGPAIGLRFGW